MKMNLLNTDYLATGIFGVIEPDDESLLLYTLQHSYPVVPMSDKLSTNYEPKIPRGTYTCLRGIHRLLGMDHDFETFEITGVEGHTNLLFHSGNFNKDSEGCILLGLSREDDNMILNSKEAFKLFMDLQNGVDSFALTLS